MSTQVEDFKLSTEKLTCIKNGIKFHNLIFQAEEYIPKQRVIQCYNCYKYGHVAKFCRQKHPTCHLCSGKHSQDECHQQLRICRNCLSTQHYANSKNCEVFQQLSLAMKQKELTAAHSKQKINTNNYSNHG